MTASAKSRHKSQAQARRIEQEETEAREEGLLWSLCCLLFSAPVLTANLLKSQRRKLILARDVLPHWRRISFQTAEIPCNGPCKKPVGLCRMAPCVESPPFLLSGVTGN